MHEIAFDIVESRDVRLEGTDINEFNFAEGEEVCNEPCHRRTDVNMPIGPPFMNMSCRPDVLVEVVTRGVARGLTSIAKDRLHMSELKRE
jgi:hypothetical protein